MPPRRFITYVVTTVLVFWIILGAVTLPNASKWLRGTGHAINKDIVFFNRSEYPAINNGIPIKYGVKVISMNVLPVDNAPNVPREGVKGILYDLGESCGDDEPKLVPKSPFLNGRKNLTRIALVKQSENCFLADKIINAELDGALGVIIYQQKNSLTDYRGLGVMPKTVNIPAFYVEPDVGTMLLRDVATYYKKRNTTDLDHSELMVRVHLLPSTKPKLDYWQFALIIIGGMVLISVIAVVATQYHLWRIAKQRQRQRFENVENNNETTVLTRDEQRQLAADEGFWTGIMGQASPPAPRRTRFNYILDQALVDLLPTRIFHSKPEDDSNDDLTDEKTEVELNEPIVDYEPSHCVICLDEFADGDILRRLPCCHEYHRDCIDIWLTKKSSSCPLCLAPVSIPTVPEEGHTRDDSVDSQDLAQTWINLSRAQATSLRTHPFAYNQTPREY